MTSLTRGHTIRFTRPGRALSSRAACARADSDGGDERNPAKMADRRKLQAEIDRTMKKIDEGIEVYDRIFLKVEGAETKEHNEKYEVRARF